MPVIKRYLRLATDPEMTNFIEVPESVTANQFNLDGLESDTQYFIEAAVTNSRGTGISEQRDFETLADTRNYLNFTNEGSETATLTLRASNTSSQLLHRIEVSEDRRNWSFWENVQATGVKRKEYALQAGHTVWMRCTVGTFSSTNFYHSFSVPYGSHVTVAGSIESLIDSNMSGYKLRFALTQNCFDHLFYSSNLYFGDLILPFKIMGTGCYKYLFANNAHLTKAPHLPATTMAANCYERIFSGCPNLTQISCDFTSWTAASSQTSNWTYGLPAHGLFTCPRGLPLTVNAIGNTTNPNYIPYDWHINANDYLTFTNNSPYDLAIQLFCTRNIGLSRFPSLYYSFDGSTWSKWDDIRGGTSSTKSNLYLTIPAGQHAYIRGDNEGFSRSLSEYFYFYGTTRDPGYCLVATGSILSLLSADLDLSRTTQQLGDYEFYSLFSTSTILVNSKLTLPFTRLGSNSYTYMFSGNTRMIYAPAIIDAEIVGNEAYKGFFSGCSKLTSVLLLAREWDNAKCDGWMNRISTTGTIYHYDGVNPTIPSTWTSTTI